MKVERIYYTVWVLRREATRTGHLVDVTGRGRDLVVDRSHLQLGGATCLRHLGNHEVAESGTQFGHETAARHVTCTTHTHTHTNVILRNMNEKKI